MKNVALLAAAAMVLGLAAWTAAQDEETATKPEFGKAISEGGGIAVYKKADFDKENPFQKEANAAISLEERPEYVAGGKSLYVKRAADGGYFGARTSLAVQGSGDLKFAFLIRAKGMESVTLNAQDEIKKDNTTPTCLAHTPDRWRSVVYYAKDFHFNSDQPQKKIPARVKYTGMFFHGVEEKDAKGEYWIDNFIVYRGYDTQAPEKIAKVNAKVLPRPDNNPSDLVELTWEQPNDNALVAVYSIFRKSQRAGAAAGWTKVGESLQARFVDIRAGAGEHAYRVTAADYESNCSPPSDEVNAKVQNEVAATYPAKPVQESDRENYADNVRKIHEIGGKDGKVKRDVFLYAGDSITAADAYIFALGGWVGRGVPVQKGVGQMTTAFGKAQIKGYLDEAKPEFAVIMYGTNNDKSEKGIEAGMKDIEFVIDACAEFGTVPIIATIPPRGGDKNNSVGEKNWAAAVAKLCREKKVPASYCFEEMIASPATTKEILGDGVHLTPGLGNELAGEALLKTLEQAYWALRDTSGSWK